MAQVPSSDLSIFDLSGKKALITGGAGGIGRACAIGMAKAGADVAIADQQTEIGMQTADEIRALGRKSLFVRCDVSDVSSVDSMVAEVVDSFGRLDIAFNNAGISGSEGASTDDVALEIWNRVLATNLTGTFYCCRAEAKYMIPQKYGKIINTASMSATIVNNVGFPDGIRAVAYCASKAGVKHLTKALAAEWVGDNICVNSISPGWTLTPLTQFLHEVPEFLKFLESITPMHRLANPQELVGGVLYLASDASSYTTGTDLIMDGGHTIW